MKKTMNCLFFNLAIYSIVIVISLVSNLSFSQNNNDSGVEQISLDEIKEARAAVATLYNALEEAESLPGIPGEETLYRVGHASKQFAKMVTVLAGLGLLTDILTNVNSTSASAPRWRSFRLSRFTYDELLKARNSLANRPNASWIDIPIKGKHGEYTGRSIRAIHHEISAEIEARQGSTPPPKHSGCSKRVKILGGFTAGAALASYGLHILNEWQEDRILMNKLQRDMLMNNLKELDRKLGTFEMAAEVLQ